MSKVICVVSNILDLLITTVVDEYHVINTKASSIKDEGIYFPIQVYQQQTLFSRQVSDPILCLCLG